MILTPTKKEHQKNLLINVYELPATIPATPTTIKVWFFDEVKTGRYTSQAEFLSRRIIEFDMNKFNYIVDDIAAWKILEGGETLQVIIVGQKGKKNGIKLLAYLLEKYQLKMEDIILGFEDKNFILQLKAFLEY